MVGSCCYMCLSVGGVIVFFCVAMLCLFCLLFVGLVCWACLLGLFVGLVCYFCLSVWWRGCMSVGCRGGVACSFVFSGCLSVCVGAAFFCFAMLGLFVVLFAMICLCSALSIVLLYVFVCRWRDSLFLFCLLCLFAVVFVLSAVLCCSVIFGGCICVCRRAAGRVRL